MRTKAFLLQCALYTAALLLSEAGAFCQAPGGVRNDLTSWFKANGHVTTVPADSKVLGWTSELGNIRVSASAPSRRPVLKATNTDKGNFNFNPFIQFNQDSLTFLGRPTTVPDLLGSHGTIFLIANMVEDSRNEHTAFTYRASTAYRYQMKPGWRIQVGLHGMGWTQDLYKEAVPFQAPLHSAIILVSRSNGPEFRGRKNGDSLPLVHSNEHDFEPAVVAGLYMGANHFDGTEPYNGGIAEAITYKSDLSNEEVNKIESYLAVKYGVTLCQQSQFGKTPSNYTASNGTVLWNAADNKGYGHCITAIGRDDSSGLLQKQSFSGHHKALLYLYNDSTKGTFPVSNVENKSLITENTSFLLIGDNAQPTTLTTCVAGKKYKRMGRIWKVQKTGTGIHVVTIAVNKSDVPVTAKGILVSAGNEFNAGASNYHPFTQKGSLLYASVKLNDGDYFTIVSAGTCQ